MGTSITTQQAKASERADIYQRITDRIAAAIEAGAGEWRMPWHPGADGAAPVLPINAATGKPYRGVNTIVLWATAQAEGYPSAPGPPTGNGPSWVRRSARVSGPAPWCSGRSTTRMTRTAPRMGRRTIAGPGCSRAATAFNAAQVDGYASLADVERARTAQARAA